MEIALAVILGFLFGFVLQKIGAANPQKIIGMLCLKDLHLMKVIFLAIGVSSLALFALLAAGIVDSTHLSVKSSYVGVVIGGGILGLGWAVSGFCPGTGLVAAGAGRRDALSFLLGGLVGAFLFMLAYEPLKDTFLFNQLGDKMSLAVTENEHVAALLPNFPALAAAGGIAVVFIAIACLLPERT